MYTPNSNNLNNNNITQRPLLSSRSRLDDFDERNDITMASLQQEERERARLAQAQEEYRRDQNLSQQLQHFQQQPQLQPQTIQQPQPHTVVVPTQPTPSATVIFDKHCLKPESFDGTNGSNARQFLNGLFIYCHATNIPESKRPAVASSYFKGEALNWVTVRTMNIIKNNIVDSWQQFESDFLKRYDPVSAESRARHILSSLKLGNAPTTTIDQYINKFDEQLIHLSTMDERTKIHAFNNGLPQNVRIHFATTQHKLQDILNYVIVYRNIIQSSKLSTSTIVPKLQI